MLAIKYFFLGLFLNNLLLFYLFSLFCVFKNLLLISFKTDFDLKNNNLPLIKDIIFGYSIFLIFFYHFYFFFRFNHVLLDLIFLISILPMFFFVKKFKYYFFSKINLVLNIIVIIFLITAALYGEQYYIFRGNYWDSSNYLSSALLFKEFNYDEILNKGYSNFFSDFQSIDYIVKARPLVNYILSFFLNLPNKIFFSYYLLKVFLITLIFLSLNVFIKKIIKQKSVNYVLVISTSFVFSFWSIYVFEIDALSHLASIPILILTMNYFLDLFDDITNKNLYLKLVILNSALFLIYPEILIIPFLVLLTLILVNLKKLNIKFIKFSLLSIITFGILTFASIETNYKYLFNSQLNQSNSINDWWGYFGGFILGKETLIHDETFVNQLKNFTLKNNNILSLLDFIKTNHFDSGYYFIFLNIIPSLSGLYFLLPGKIVSVMSFGFILNFILLILIYIIIIKIFFTNVKYIISKKKYFKKFSILFFLCLILIIYFLLHGNYWVIIKFSTYLFPFIFLFFSINFKYKTANFSYLFLVSLFFLYKFSLFNYGIGRLDSFPSIINPNLKKNINWVIENKKLENCYQFSSNVDNYIIKTYLKLKVYKKENDSNILCKVYLKDKKFIVEYEK